MKNLNIIKIFTKKHYIELIKEKYFKLNQELLKSNIAHYDYIVTIEEQSLDGGFGSIISEFICDNQLTHKLLRLGLPEKFIFENGSRDHLIDTHGLSTEEIYNNINNFIK